jgi:prepilin-type N-terminal cleavage/methylation domain-containing protein
LSPRALHRRPRRRRHAFTLIELLVVIGVILILVGMSIVGLNQIGKHSKDQHTKAALEAMRAMMTELQAAGGKENTSKFDERWGNYRLVGGNQIVQAYTPSATDNISIYRQGATPAFNNIPWQQVSDWVLAELLTVPSNKAILDKLPAEQVKQVSEADEAGNTRNFYEILDGYGRPLRFVPSQGFQGSTPTFSSASITTSGTVIRQMSDGSVHTVVAATVANPPANPRPFWLSAGADGNYKSLDDNLVSTNQ